jgi:hypothetical protein
MEDSDDGVCFSRASLLKALENYDSFEIGWSLKEIDFEGVVLLAILLFSFVDAKMRSWVMIGSRT